MDIPFVWFRTDEGSHQRDIATLTTPTLPNPQPRQYKRILNLLQA